MLFRRMSLQLLLVLVLVLGFCAPVWAENIEQSMTPEEFKAAGLDKLNAEELAQLNAWLQRSPQAQVGSDAAATSSATPTPVASAPVDTGPPILAKYRKNDPGAAGAVAEVDEVHSSIIGYFEGWRKGSIFKLENGQHWRVTDARRFEAPSEDSPKVRIKSAAMGSWLLYVGEYNRSARVQRIK